MKNTLLCFLLFVFCSVSFGQKLEKIAKLPEKLNEISGLCFLNDTVLVGHNDGGNDPILYFINLKGKVIHLVEVTEAKNNDWEDLATDGKGHIYIADIGNNNNSRKKLHIYKIPTWNILKKDKVAAEEIEFTYAEQTEYPADEKDMHFDGEALAYYKDSLYIFTKCRTEPFDGKSFVYTVSTTPGKYELTKKTEIFLGKGTMYKDAVTGAAIFGDICYLLTYNRIQIYKIKNGKFEFFRKITLHPFTQKEALATRDNKVVYITDEKHKILGGGNLYKIKLHEK